MENNHKHLKALSLIAHNGPVSRIQIGQHLSILPPTVTKIVNDLIQKDLVSENGYEKSTGGRKAALLDLKDNSHILCGIQISQSSVKIVFMDLKANVLKKDEFVAPLSTTPDEMLSYLEKSMNKCLDSDSSFKERLLGIGVGISGLVDSETGISYSCHRFPNWCEVNIKKEIQDRFGFPTFLENNVNLSTLAELWFGTGKGKSNFIYIYLGPGIRMGIVINGTLYRGSTGNAGELGHTTYSEKGPICYCGNTGCLETFVSSDVLLTMAKGAITPGSDSILAEKFSSNKDDLNPEDIYNAALDNDRFSISILQRLCHPIGLVLSNLVNLFDVEAIIIGGSLAKAGDVVLNYLENEVRAHSLPRLNQNLSFNLASFKNKGTAIGGGALVLQKVCEGTLKI